MKFIERSNMLRLLGLLNIRLTARASIDISTTAIFKKIPEMKEDCAVVPIQRAYRSRVIPRVDCNRRGGGVGGGDERGKCVLIVVTWQVRIRVVFARLLCPQSLSTKWWWLKRVCLSNNLKIPSVSAPPPPPKIVTRNHFLVISWCILKSTRQETKIS